MLVDFAVDSSGDLIFTEQDVLSNSLKVSFAFSKTKAMKIVFDFIECEPSKHSDHALKISFDLVKKTANKSVAIHKDQDAIQQLLTLKLKTTLGELPLRKEFGSKLSLLKHKEINDNNLKILEHYILEAISDIVTNPKVEAVPYINYNNGYQQTILVKIYDSKREILHYIIER